MGSVLQIFFDSLLLAGLYAMGALGFALLWGVLNVLNIAHAAFIMMGGYVTFGLWQLGLDPLLALPLTMVALFGIGWLVQRVLIDQIVGGPPSLGVALTYGLNLVIVGLALHFLSAEYRSIVPPDYLRGYVGIAGAKLTYVRLATIVIALAVTAAVWWFMDRTELGTAIRATRLDLEAAQLVGVRVRTIFNITTALSAALAGAMGGLLALVYSTEPGLGDHYLLQILIVTVLGGLGSIIGPLVGAFVVGISYSLVAHFWSGAYSTLVGTFLVLIVLLLRPSGLLGKRFYET